MASTPPLIFKRTKGKQTQRARHTSPENDTENGATTDGTDIQTDSPSALAVKLKDKLKRAKPKSRLSFGGDDDEEGDGEVFQVKKSNLSKKVALGKGKYSAAVPLNLEQATISPNRGPTYDQAYLNQLKASTPTSRPPMPQSDDSYDADMSLDRSIDMGDVSMTNLDLKTEQPELSIPSESSIKVAKEKRERVRKTQASGEDDYISLSVTRKSDYSEGPHPESRLVREEDELGEGDDEFAEYTSAQERIALGKKSRKVEASKRRESMKELIDDAAEEDEETVEWEQEQLRRGGHRTPEPSMSKVKATYKPAPIPPETPVPNLTNALSHLAQQLSRLTASHAINTAALSNLAKEQSDVTNRETEMREMVGKAENKRAWFDSFREWIEGVAGFLDEKYPLLENLEEEHISILRERFELITQRRRAEDEDDLAIFMGDIPATEPKEPESEELDEYGRVIPKPNPAAQRRERRVARTARRQARLQRKAKAEAEEGYSTDSSLPEQVSYDYTEALKSLSTRKKEVLADVRAEEFRDPGKGRWNAWRESYADSYVGAWGGLGVVSVWEFWVRLESVGWDCLEDQRSLDSFKWYKGLYEYSRPGSSDMPVEARELGPDGDLVASMIATAVIPRICKVLEGGALDVYSERHIRRLVDLVEEVEASVESGNVKLHMLLKSVLSKFETAISDTESLLEKHKVAPTGAPGFNPEAIPARLRLLARRVKLLKNLLRWRKYIGERFGIGVLINRLVEGCILEVAESGWDVGGQLIGHTVAGLLPDELVPSELKRRLAFR